MDPIDIKLKHVADVQSNCEALEDVSLHSGLEDVRQTFEKPFKDYTSRRQI